MVALKMGERGSLVCTHDALWEVKPFQVQALDATGAGDAFSAGFLAGVLNGFEPQKCASLGNVVGALCVTKVGTVDGIRSLPETLDFIDSSTS